MTNTLSYLENAWGAQPLDINTLILWLSGYGVVEGVGNECDVVPNTGTYGATDTITVQAGDVLVNGTRHSVASTDLTIQSPSSSDRKDIVYVDNSGTPKVEAGDPATAGTEPSGGSGRNTWRPHPDDFSGITGTPLKEVYVASTSGSVSSGDLSERRWYTTLQVEEADIRNLTAALDAQNNQIQNPTLAGANLSLAAALDASSNDINNVGTLGAATVNPTNLGATSLTGNMDASSNQIQNAVLDTASLNNALDASTQNINNVGTLGGPALSNATLTNALDASTQDINNVGALDADTLDVQNETAVYATGGNASLTSSGAWNDLTGWSESTDERNEFGSDSFTPDSTGWYHVSLNVEFGNSGADEGNLFCRVRNETDGTTVGQPGSSYYDKNIQVNTYPSVSGSFELTTGKSYVAQAMRQGDPSPTGNAFWSIRSAFR